MSDVLSPGPADGALATPSPCFTAGQIATLVAARWGLSGTARLLTSERDQNFRFASDRGEAFVVKVTNPAEDPLVTDFQTGALLHIEARDPTLPVPRVLRTLAGAPQCVVEGAGGAPTTVRVLSYLDGLPLHQAPRNPAQRRALGIALARLGRALSDFRHPAAAHFLQWDIQNAARLRPLLPCITDAGDRHLAAAFLDRFDTVVAPQLPTLRRQIVHNDLNPYNVLVAGEDMACVTGIFDFGDMVETALVNDVAVAASYQLAAGDDPLRGIVEFVSGYATVCPLEEREAALLLDLIAARMLTTVAITSWRAARYPENSAYILRNSPSAWHGLHHFAAVDRAAASARLAAAATES